MTLSVSHDTTATGRIEAHSLQIIPGADLDTVAWERNDDLCVSLKAADDRHHTMGSLTHAEHGIVILGHGIDEEPIVEIHTQTSYSQYCDDKSTLTLLRRSITALEGLAEALARINGLEGDQRPDGALLPEAADTLEPR